MEKSINNMTVAEIEAALAAKKAAEAAKKSEAVKPLLTACNTKASKALLLRFCGLTEKEAASVLETSREAIAPACQGFNGLKAAGMTVTVTITFNGKTYNF